MANSSTHKQSPKYQYEDKYTKSQKSIDNALHALDSAQQISGEYDPGIASARATLLKRKEEIKAEQQKEIWTFITLLIILSAIGFAVFLVLYGIGIVTVEDGAIKFVKKSHSSSSTSTVSSTTTVTGPTTTVSGPQPTGS